MKTARTIMWLITAAFTFCNTNMARADVLEQKRFTSIWYYEWLVEWGDIYTERSCDRGQILYLKDIAEREALDKCLESGARDCRINGAIVLYNGKLESAEAYRLRGRRPPNSIVSGANWHGCIVRGSANGTP